LTFVGGIKCHTIEQTEKCTRQLAVIAAMNAKFHSNQKKADQSIAKNVFRNIGTTSTI